MELGGSRGPKERVPSVDHSTHEVPGFRVVLTTATVAVIGRCVLMGLLCTTRYMFDRWVVSIRLVVRPPQTIDQSGLPGALHVLSSNFSAVLVDAEQDYSQTSIHDPVSLPTGRPSMAGSDLVVTAQIDTSLRHRHYRSDPGSWRRNLGLGRFRLRKPRPRAWDE